MADIDFKNSVNVDTAYVDGHKVKLIAVPDGTLELPISANDEYGYVVDANGKKHRVLLVTFLEGEPDYKQSPTADTAYMTINSQKVKVRLGAKLNGTQYLSNSANVNDGYTEDDDGNKHRTILVSEPTGTLELPTSETSDSAYVIDNDGNKHKVRLFAVLAGGTTIVEVTVSGVPPLSLIGAVENSVEYVKAFGGLLQSGVPSGYTAVEYVENAANTLVRTDFIPTNISSIKIDIVATASIPTSSTGRTFYIFQARETTATPIFGIAGAQSTLAISGSGTNNSVTSSTTRTNGHQYRIIWEATGGNQSLVVDDLTAGTTRTNTNTYTSFTGANSPMCLFGNAGTLDPSGTATEVNRIYQGAQVYYAKMWANGKLVLDLVPAIRNSDNAVGLYNRVNGQFLTASEGSLTAGNEIAPTPSDPVDLVCNNGTLKILDKSDWTIFTNPTSIPRQGVWIDTNGKWYSVDDRGAGCAIPLTIGKQYTLVIHKKTAVLGTMLRYGQSPQATPTLTGIQLTDWYRGDITDGQMISFVAKQPYLVMQLGSAAAEAGMIQEAIEVLEAQGDNETLAITTKNIYNPANDIVGKYIDSSGNIQTADTGVYQMISNVEVGKTYTFSTTYTRDAISNTRIHAYKSDNTSNGELAHKQNTTPNSYSLTFTIPADTAYIGVSHNRYDTNTQVEVGSTKTSYIEYNGSTAGVANLLKIGNYVDTQEILTGLINHQLGIYVFDGTEDWETTAQSTVYRLTSPILFALPNTCICSHYTGVNSSLVIANMPNMSVKAGSETLSYMYIKDSSYSNNLSGFKQFLANQYAAGTPVIVVYPLATAQDEVAPVPQTMQTVAGDNTLDIVQAGMSGLEVSATYMKGVSVTITEIENANIGNSVEVVIA